MPCDLINCAFKLCVLYLIYYKSLTRIRLWALKLYVCIIKLYVLFAKLYMYVYVWISELYVRIINVYVKFTKLYVLLT